MLGQLIIYPLFVVLCFAGLFRPWIALVGFYGCVLLEPSWNWRWSIPEDFAFQKYLAASTLLGFLLNGYPGNRLDKDARLPMACLVGFLALAYLSGTNTIDERLSASYLSNLWKIVLMALLAVRLLDTPSKIWVFLLVLAFMQGYSAFRINEQYFLDGYSLYARRDWGTKGDNNLYSNLTIPMIACSGAICLFAEKRWQMLLAGLVFLLQIHQLMLMESRGAMIGAVGMLGILAFYMPRNRFTISAACLALTAGAVLAGPPVVREFSSAFASSENLDTSAESRYKLWKAGYAITMDYPLLGVGPWAGQRLVPKYYEGGLGAGRKGLHNLYFEITTGCGIPAAFLYFAFFLIPWFYSWKAIRRVGRDPDTPKWYGAVLLATVAGIPGYLAGSMFSSGAMLEPPYALASLAIAAHCLVGREETVGIESEEPLEDPVEVDHSSSAQGYFH